MASLGDSLRALVASLVSVACGGARTAETAAALPAPSAAPRGEATPPSRAELLRFGGFYPIPVPLTWKLIGTDGEDVAIPPIEGSPFHRILARGALLATETSPGSPPEAMTLSESLFPYHGAPSAALLERYTETLISELSRQRLAPRVVSQQVFSCAVSQQACAKLVIERNADSDNRTELRYLLRDQASLTWELVYLVRRDNLPQWAPLFAELEGSAAPAPAASAAP